MFVPKIFLPVLLILMMQLHTPVLSFADDPLFDNSMKQIANTLAGSLRDSRITKVAVLEPESVNGEVSELGVVIAESITGYLFESRKGLRVIERRLLGRILEEHGFNRSGLVDEESIQKLGKILGVEGIIIGTIAKINSSYRINLRLLDVKTAEVIAVSRGSFNSDTGLDNAFARQIRPRPTRSVISSRNPETGSTTPGNAVLDLNWKNREDGDFPDGFGGLRIFSAFGGKVLGSPGEGDYSFELPVYFPSDFRLSMELGGNTGNSNRRCILISLFSPDGRLPLYICPHPVGGGEWDAGFIGTKMSGSVKCRNDKPTEVELIKKGDVYKLYIANKMVVALRDNKFTQFNGFKIKFTSNTFITSSGYIKGHFISRIRLTQL